MLVYQYRLFLPQIFALCCFCPCCVTSLNVTLFLHLPYNIQPYSCEFLGPAIDMAFEEIVREYNNSGLNVKQDRQIFPSIYRCDQALSVIGQLTAKYYYDQIAGKENTTVVFFVTGCSEVMAYAADFAREVNAPYITSAGSEAFMDDKKRFPTSTRFLPYQASDVVACFLQLLQKFSWFHTTLIFESSATYYNNIGLTLKTALKSNSKTSGATIFSYDAEANGTLEFGDYLANAIRVSRVILLVTPMQQVQTLLIAAWERGMTNGDYIYIAWWPFFHDQYGDIKWQHFDGKENITKDIFRSLLIITPQIISSSNLTQFEREIVLRSAKDYKHVYQPGVPINPHVFDTFTALTETFEAIATVFRNGDDALNGALVSQQMWSKNLTTMFGVSIMDETGDQLATYSILSFSPAAEKFTEVLTFDSITGTLSELAEKQIFWPNTANVPVIDVPVCGFLGEKSICIPPRKVAALVWILTTVLVLIVAGTLIFILRKRHENILLRDSIWRISPQKLQRGTNHSKSMHSFRRNLNPTVVVPATVVLNPDTGVGFYFEKMVWIKSIKLIKKFVPTNTEKYILTQIVTVRHPNVVTCLGMFFDNKERVEVITEFCPKGSLRDLLDMEIISLDMPFRSSLINDLVSGITYLHTSSTFHRHGNLKSTNCLLDNHFTVQLTDFGLDFLPVETLDGPMYYSRRLWAAPEILRNFDRAPRTQENDIFSFAVIVQEIFTGTYPYDDYQETKITPEPHRIIDWLTSTSYPPFRWKTWKDCPDAVKSLINCCWEENPARRPTILEVRGFLNIMGFSSGKNLLDSILHRMQKYAQELEETVDEKTAEYLEEKKRSEAVLYQILPEAIARTLASGNVVYPEWYDQVTVCFTGIADFLTIAMESTPLQLVTFLNELYSLFDSLLEVRDVYKVETISDSYVVASGVPVRNGIQHSREIALLAIKLLENAQKFKIAHRPGKPLFLITGVNTGSVATGVVGVRAPRYCLFGDTVNTASRMVSTGEALKVHISKQTKEALEPFAEEFCWESRGLTEIKGKGKQESFWLFPKIADVKTAYRFNEIML